MASEEGLSISTNRYRSIVKKAIENLNSKDKQLNLSQDNSFDSLRKRKKVKKTLSQSFVMRQTTALSTKNKQLVQSLTQSKQQTNELEQSLRKMQDNFMMVIMKLNSREVALNKCLQELEETKERFFLQEEQYNNLRNQLQAILDNTAPCSDNINGANKICHSPINFSLQPRRVPVKESKASATPIKAKMSKWKPDLTMVQEKKDEDPLLEISTPHSVSEPVTSAANECSKKIENAVVLSPTSSLQLWLTSSNESSFNDDVDLEKTSTTPDFEAVSEKDRQTIVLSNRKRRRTSLFSRCSFDLKDDCNGNEELKNLDHMEVANNINVVLPTEENILSQDVISSEASNIEKENVENQCSKDDKIPGPGSLAKSNNSRPKKVKFCKSASDASQDDVADKTNLSQISMELTQPIDNNIIVRKSTKRTRKNTTKISKKVATRKAAKKKTKKLETINVESDVYNCSNDSFLINPDKKIQLSQPVDTSQAKQRSLPMTNITNEANIGGSPSGRTRRRTAPVSYVVSLKKKMRREDS